MGQELRDRSKALPPGVRTHAWKAQVRLCGRFARLSRRGVQANKVCVAVARELTGFIWAIAQLSAAESTSQQ
jgi:transposase